MDIQNMNFPKTVPVNFYGFAIANDSIDVQDITDSHEVNSFGLLKSKLTG